jgi:hypothetical protein
MCALYKGHKKNITRVNLNRMHEGGTLETDHQTPPIVLHQFGVRRKSRYDCCPGGHYYWIRISKPSKDASMQSGERSIIHPWDYDKLITVRPLDKSELMAI